MSNDQIALLTKFKEQTAAFLSLLDQAQIQLQFGDRVVQQFNEILKVMQKINSIISKDTSIDQATMQSSTKFALHEKKSQKEIDDLFTALKSGSG